MDINGQLTIHKLPPTEKNLHRAASFEIIKHYKMSSIIGVECCEFPFTYKSAGKHLKVGYYSKARTNVQEKCKRLGH